MVYVYMKNNPKTIQEKVKESQADFKSKYFEVGHIYDPNSVDVTTISKCGDVSLAKIVQRISK